MATEKKKRTYNTISPRNCKTNQSALQLSLSSQRSQRVPLQEYQRSLLSTHSVCVKCMTSVNMIVISCVTILHRCCKPCMSRISCPDSHTLHLGENSHAARDGQVEAWSHGQLQEHHSRRRVRSHSSWYLPQLTDTLIMYRFGRLYRGM